MASVQLDVWLDRLAKVAGILLPITIAVVGGVYTYQKDGNDEALRKAQETRDDNQKTFDNTQKKYSNLTALLPLLVSEKEAQVRIGLEIYSSEAGVRQAPTDLQSAIGEISNRFPKQASLVQSATEAGRRQQGEECKASADGLYVQVANSDEQLALGKAMADRLTASDVSPAVQGVQRIDQGPRSTELRYYFSNANTNQANGIISKLQTVGIPNITKVDLTRKYLKGGCIPPAVYELWIGASSPLVKR